MNSFDPSYPIIITRDLDIRFEDLYREVDFSIPFTLFDVIQIAAESSHISLETMCRILHCPYIYDYFLESQNPSLNKTEEIEYLELYWMGDKVEHMGEIESVNRWEFRGIGRKGFINEDIKNLIPIEERAKYRETYALDFGPVNETMGLEIKLRQEMSIRDTTNPDQTQKEKYSGYIVPFVPSITLIEMLYAVFAELSACGSPQERDALFEMLGKRIQKIKEDEGAGEVITIPSEEVKARIKKILKENKTLICTKCGFWVKGIECSIGKNYKNCEKEQNDIRN